MERYGEALNRRVGSLVSGDPHWVPVRHPGDGLLANDTVAHAIAAGADFRYTGEHYRLDGRLAQIAPELITTRTIGKHYFNGSKARIVQLPRTRNDETVLAYATYRDQQITHELGANIVHDRQGHPIDLLSLWVEEGIVLPVDRSRTANTFGVSLLAITHHRNALLTQRADTMLVQPGCLDTTASGSCEPPRRSRGKFLDYLTDQALRELDEETGIGSRHVDTINLVTVTRDLTRGGLVDFHLLATLRPSAEPQIGGEVARIITTEPLECAGDATHALNENYGTAGVTGNVRTFAALTANIEHAQSTETSPIPPDRFSHATKTLSAVWPATRKA